MGAVYDQLSITERRKIERWRHAKVPVDEMARVLKRCRSTIFRELKRNHFTDENMPGCDGYYGAAAHLMQAERRRTASSLTISARIKAAALPRANASEPCPNWPSGRI
ncbi:MAG TPA: hypothetical protein DIU10_07155 [Sulfitobacter sp.]|nr:hypothetical protein [Sulfitobacter sp.]